MFRKKHKGKTKKTSQKNKRPVFVFALLFVVVVFVVGLIYLVVLARSLPSPEQFSVRQVNQSTKIYDRSGEVVLYELHGDEKRTVVSFDQIPDVVKETTLVAEDANFYNEPAFDWRGILRALITNIQQGQFVQGGSTITQQLAKNVFLSADKTITRKIKELILSVELESKYNKNEILSLYLNQIPYGSNAYGV